MKNKRGHTTVDEMELKSPNGCMPVIGDRPAIALDGIVLATDVSNARPLRYHFCFSIQAL
jgi:hypothetical protein